mmetsp:Transcript_48286/g.134221  ORF Transcript_48286/g.134221 Transcript_48286/m.134221 type:complete len:179 (+) Transcript_48286:433-969(+)
MIAVGTRPNRCTSLEYMNVELKNTKHARAVSIGPRTAGCSPYLSAQKTVKKPSKKDWPKLYRKCMQIIVTTAGHGVDGRRAPLLAPLRSPSRPLRLAGFSPPCPPLSAAAGGGLRRKAATQPAANTDISPLNRTTKGRQVKENSTPPRVGPTMYDKVPAASRYAIARGKDARSHMSAI